MAVKIFDLTRQYANLRHELEPKIISQLESGGYIGGNAVKEFEQHFASYLGVKYAVSVNSGTDALILAMQALKIGKGDEVITTAFSFFATAEAIARVGAVPVFVDVDENFNLNADNIEDKITNKTKAILPVHIFGNPANMGRIKEIAGKYHLSVIEDACQAAGAEYHQIKVGGLGDIGCFSFFPTKNLGAFGDAGMITVNSEQLAILCKAFKEHGMGENGAKAKSILDGGVDGSRMGENEESAVYSPNKYYNYLVAGNSRMDALQAVVLDVKLRHLDSFNQRRREIAQLYHSRLKNINAVQLPEESKDGVSVWHQYAIRCSKKKELGEYLAAKGIGTGVFYPVPLHLQKAFQYLNYKEGDFPVAEQVCKETVCLPIYPELEEGEIQEVAEGIREFFGR